MLGSEVRRDIHCFARTFFCCWTDHTLETFIDRCDRSIHDSGCDLSSCHIFSTSCYCCSDEFLPDSECSDSCENPEYRTDHTSDRIGFSIVDCLLEFMEDTLSDLLCYLPPIERIDDMLDRIKEYLSLGGVYMFYQLDIFDDDHIERSFCHPSGGIVFMEFGIDIKTSVYALNACFCCIDRFLPSLNLLGIMAHQWCLMGDSSRSGRRGCCRYRSIGMIMGKFLLGVIESIHRFFADLAVDGEVVSEIIESPLEIYCLGGIIFNCIDIDAHDIDAIWYRLSTPCVVRHIVSRIRIKN